MAGAITWFSILQQEHPILHELTIYGRKFGRKGEEGDAPKFTLSGSIVTVSEPATLL